MPVSEAALRLRLSPVRPQLAQMVYGAFCFAPKIQKPPGRLERLFLCAPVRTLGKAGSANPHEVHMHIRSFIGAALLCLGMLALAPSAMADPAPDICILDINPAADHVYDAAVAAPACSSAFLAVQPVAWLSPGGDEDEAAGPSLSRLLIALDFAGPRLHFDPGRDLG